MQKLNEFYELSKGSHHNLDIKVEFDLLYQNLNSFNITGLNNISHLENKFDQLLELIIKNISNLSISLKNESLDKILDLIIDEWDILNLPDNSDIEIEEDFSNLLDNLINKLTYYFNILKSS